MLDTGCTYRSGGPLVFSIPVDRYIGDVQKLKANGLIPSTATLKLPAWDIDLNGGVPGQYAPEHDRISFNGHILNPQVLQGDNQIWQLNEFSIPIEWVNFPDDPGPGGTIIPKDNVVQIDIDVDNAGSGEYWCTAIDWATLAIEAPRPVVMVHGILSSGAAWDKPGFSWVSKLNDLGIPNSNRLNMGDLDSIQSNAGKIAAEVNDATRRWGVDKVAIVAHSKGGIDSRHFVECNDSVAKLTQLGTPNAGSPLADYAQGILTVSSGLANSILINDLAGPAGVQLTTPYMKLLYNPFHGHNANVSYTTLAGDYNPNCAFCVDSILLALVGKGDTIVPISSVHALDYTDKRVIASTAPDISANHTGLNHSERVFQAVQDRVVSNAAVSGKSASPALSVSRTAAYAGLVAPGKTVKSTLAIEQSVPANFTLMYKAGNLDFALTSPSGQRFDSGTVAGNPNVTYDAEQVMGGWIKSFSFASPQVGLWTIDVTASSTEAPAGVGFSVSAWLQNPALTFEGKVVSPNVHLGEALVLTGTVVSSGIPVANAVTTAKILLPDQTTSVVSLHDDGLNGDAVNGDGVYTGTFTGTNQPGTYRVTFMAKRDTAPAFSREDFTLATVSRSFSGFANSYTDSGFDTDGDGLYNFLSINTDVNITESTNYRLMGILTDKNGNELTTSLEQALDPGKHTLTLNFDGNALYKAGIDGPYTLTVIRLAEENGLDILPNQVLTNVYTTAPYSYLQFQHPNVVLTGTGTSTGIDTNGNGKFDTLRASFGVSIRNAGSYTWSARLADKNGTQIGLASNAGNLSVGLNMLTLEYDGTKIGSNKIDGPYYVKGLLISGAGDSLVASDVLTTAPFLAGQFEGYPSMNPIGNAGGPYNAHVGIPVILDASASNDPDGKIVRYEWDVNNDGTYDISTTTSTVSYTFHNPYSGSVRLRVTDNDGLTGTATSQATIINTPPVSIPGGP
jgi:pimeloyl-ACP methyl ester carboxylesterase